MWYILKYFKTQAVYAWVYSLEASHFLHLGYARAK
jgi:hypothetical protein